MVRSLANRIFTHREVPLREAPVARADRVAHEVEVLGRREVAVHAEAERHGVRLVGERDLLTEAAREPGLKGSIAEGPNHSNFSAQNSVHNSVRI